MSEVIRERAPQALHREASSQAAAEGELHRRLRERASRKDARAGWASTLSGADLKCLEAVIESQLLPRLLRAYRPCDTSPLKTGRLA